MDHTELPSSPVAETTPPKQASASNHDKRRGRAARLRKWASNHKWEIFFGLFFAWLMARFVYPPEHRPYWVRVIEVSGVDDATTKRLRALTWEWNQNPPRLGDVQVRLEEIKDVRDANLDELLKKLTHDEETLLIIGHLPTGLTKKSLLAFMQANPAVPYIATSASADNLCEACDKSQFLPWLQPSPSNTKEAESMLLFAEQKGRKECLVVTDQSSSAKEYSAELAEDLGKAAQARHITIVDTYPQGVGPLISDDDLERLSPDCVLYAGNVDIALTLWHSLPPSLWLLVSDGVIETDKVDKLARLPRDTVFFAYATDAADGGTSVFANDAVQIARTLLGDLNRRGGNLSYRLRAITHFENVQNGRHNLGLVMKENSENRVSYVCSSSWDHVCIFEGNRRENGLFHVWQQQEDAKHTGSEVSMKDVDGWHPPGQVRGVPAVRVADSTKTN